MDNFNINFKSITANCIQIGSGNVVFNDNRNSVFVDCKKQTSFKCQGCGAINKIENEKCEYCSRVKE